MFSIMPIYIVLLFIKVLQFSEITYNVYKKKENVLNKMESNINLVKSTYFIYDTDIETDLNIFAPRVKRASVY